MNSDSENTLLDNIEVKVQKILDSKFKKDSFHKRQIDHYSDRINFACPFCGDSLKDPRKKRFNIYLNSLSCHCFNCNHHSGINSFLKQFDEELSMEDKIQVHEIQQSSKKFERRISSNQSSFAFQLLDKLAVPKSILFDILKLTTPYKSKECSDYLNSRKINIKQWKYFAYNEKTKELYILNINSNDRIIGMQIRQLDPNSKKSRYLTRSLSKIYSDIFKKDILVLIERLLKSMTNGEKYIMEEDGVENIQANLDRLSGLFNVMNVDMNMPLTIVEGPIDSLCISNSIALQGATKLNDYFDDIKKVRYLFDNDKIGKEHSLNKLKSNKKVFLWGMYLKKMNIKSSNIKDINDIIKLNAFNSEIYESCFSDDEFDVLYI
jgi:hypothetical protein